MRRELKLPGVSKIEIEQGQSGFAVHYDPAKVKPEKMVELLKSAGETGTTIVN